MKRTLLIMVLMLHVAAALAQRYAFDKAPLSSDWQFLGQPDTTKYELRDDGKLRLHGDIYDFFENKSVTFMGLPVADAPFTFETKLTLFDADNGDEAGVCLYRTPEVYVQCCLNHYRSDHRLKLRLHLFGHRLLLYDRSVKLRRDLWLRISRTPDGNNYNFHYSFDGKKYHWLESVNVRLLSTTVADAESPLLLGLYAYTGSARYQAGYSYGDFEYVDFRQ